MSPIRPKWTAGPVSHLGGNQSKSKIYESFILFLIENIIAHNAASLYLEYIEYLNRFSKVV